MIEIGQKYRDMDKRMNNRVVTVIEKVGTTSIRGKRYGYVDVNVWRVHSGAVKSKIREDRLTNPRYFQIIEP